MKSIVKHEHSDIHNKIQEVIPFFLNDGNRSTKKGFLTDLHTMCKLHFENEESNIRYFFDSTIQDVIDHKNEHKRLLESIEMFIEACNSPTKELDESVLIFLTDILVRHIGKEENDQNHK